MLYIIDANNLAGKMGLIKEKDFDKKLIDIIKEYGIKENAYILVFDGVDSFGDKYTDGNITIVYAPRDEYCKSADDKIVEILESGFLKSDVGYPTSDFGARGIAVVTDDAWLKKRIEAVMVKTRNEIKIISSSLFAEKIERRMEKKTVESGGDEIDNKDDLSEDDVKDINNELIKIWK